MIYSIIFAVLGCRHPIPAQTATQQSQLSQHATSSDGTSIHFRVFGEGPPLVVINGGPGVDSNGFEGLAEALAAQHTVILFDQRGTGLSPLPEISETTITVDAHIADMEAIRNALGLSQWHVMGHSFGGILASRYVELHAEHVDKLIFSSSAGHDLTLFDTGHIEWIERQLHADELVALHELQSAYHAGDHSDALLRRHAEVLAGAYLVTDTHRDIIAERLFRANMDIGGHLTADLKAMQFDASTALSNFRSPTLIIQGAQDIMDPAMAHRLHALMPNTQLVILDDSGHYGWLDQPDVFISTVNAFLQ